MKKEDYFGEREEQAVIDYINSDSREVKNKIYNEILLIPFRIMIQSILRRYPIHIGNYEIEEVEENALTHLIEKMVTFDPYRITKSGKKAKAYSYCQTIVRNYFRDHGRTSYKEKKVNLCFDDYVDEINQNIEYKYEINDNEEHHILDILIKNVTREIDDKICNDPSIKQNEIIVGEAIINIFDNWEQLFLEDTPDGKYEKKITNKFAKNKILFFLKELTNLSTKEIRLAMKPFKEIYFIEKNDFLK